MLAVWILVAVVGALLVLGLIVFVPRRARAREAPPGAAPKGGAGPPATPAPVDTRPPPSHETRPTPSPEAPPAPPAQTPTAVPASVGAPAPAPEAGPAAQLAAPPAAPELRERMGKTRGLLSGYVRALRARSSVDDQTWDELEEGLLRADVGVATSATLLATLRERVHSGDLRGPDAVVAALRDELRRGLVTDGATGLALASDATTVWLFVGVNGVGKTTTIGKVARREVAAGHSVVLAAGDTFRAAAGEQLERWADRIGVNIVRGAEGGDPSAVVFDAVQRAAARGNDLVLADTAGRLHTKVNLVEELKKIRRVADRPPGKVTEVLLVLDAPTGQNGLAQARQFLEAVGVTGVVLTKLDGTAKGGIVVAIQRELGLPVKLVGVGEGPDDLVAFDPDQFVDALFE